MNYYKADDDLFSGAEDVEPINIEMLKLLCKKYPNDADLGEAIRSLVNTLKLKK